MKGALFWKLLERFGVQGVQFVLQIILARILSPEHYGVLSLIAIFTTLANVFIQTGFNTSLVQNKDVTKVDYSSVFWVTEGIAAVLYIVLYSTAPLIADFYNMPDIVAPFRVMALILFPGALNSIQIAKVSRDLNFKQIFKCNVSAIVISGIIGIILAYCGAGYWALVAQNLANVSIASIVMLFSVEWKPALVVNIQRVKVLFSYGWKILVSNFLENIYVDLQNLVIGKKYDSRILGYCNRGKQFPHFISNAVVDTVKSVMLPIMSQQQDSPDDLKEITRYSVKMSAYIMFPVMFGLAGVANQLITVLLTEKWLPCLIYMQIYCISFAFSPINSCNIQAVNAMGRSDIYLKLEIIKRAIGTAMIAVATICFKTPVAITMTSLIMSVVHFLLNSYPNKKLINYSCFDQIKDLLPSLIISVVMCVAVMFVGKIGFAAFPTLIIQVLAGVVIYLLLSIVMRLEPFIILKNTGMKLLKR